MRSDLMRKLWRAEDGSALVEGAIITPMLFVLVFGVIEFSYHFYQQHLVSTGVHDAARYLAHSDNPTLVETVAQNLAATGSIAGGTAPRVKGFGTGDVAVSYSFIPNDIDVSTGLRPYREATADCGGPDDIRMITVTGTFTPSRAGAWGFFGFLIPTVTAAHTERCIGRS